MALKANDGMRGASVGQKSDGDTDNIRILGDGHCLDAGHQCCLVLCKTVSQIKAAREANGKNHDSYLFFHS